MKTQLATSVAAAALAVAAAERTPLMVNEDAWYFFGRRPAEEMNVAGLQAHIDRYASGGKVTHMLFCVNGMRTAYPTKVGEPMWRTVLEDGTVLEDKKSRLRDLFDAGIDPFKVWIDRCREKGVSPWISMRINDVHFVTTGNPKSSCAFWRAHPELRRCPDDDPVKSGKWWTSFAFNYAKSEVRDYHFALFKEMADRYDADGYELDTLRFWEHLTPGREREEAHFLTEFILRCRAYTRELAQKRGHPVRLSARTLTSYDASRAFGYDPEAWAAADAVDLIVVCNFFGCVDYDFDFAAWKKRIAAANPKTRVIPGATDCFANESCRLDASAYRGWAHNMYSEGAQGLYLYNTSYLNDDTKDDICKNGLAPDRARSAARRHPLTYHDCVPKGLPTGRRLPSQFVNARPFPVNVGFAPGNGFTVEVVVGLDSTNAAPPKVSLNGAQPSGEPSSAQNNSVYGPDRWTKAVWRFPFQSAAVISGKNEVTVHNTDKNAPKTMMTWLEIQAH